MKKLISLLSTIIIGHLYVLAVEVKINDFKYELDISTKTAKVLPGDSAYFGNLVIPDTIEHEGILYIVTAIGTIAAIVLQEVPIASEIRADMTNKPSTIN